MGNKQKNGFFKKRWSALSKQKRFRIIAACVGFLLAAVAALFLAAALDGFLSQRSSVPEFSGLLHSIEILAASGKAQIIYVILVCMLFAAAVLFAIVNPTPYMADTVQVTPDIAIPKKAGQGQHGTAWFMSDTERRTIFDDVEYTNSSINELVCLGHERGVREADTGKIIIAEIEKLNPQIVKDIEAGDNKSVLDMVNDSSNISNRSPPVIVDIPAPAGQIVSLLKQAGLVINKVNTPAGEKLTCVTADTHSLIIGMTRSGKTRCLVLQTAVALAMAGESMVYSDPKGELWAYLAPFLKTMGYNVICLDFKNPLRSDRYNFLQPVIDYLLDGKPEKAEEAVEDLVNIFTPDAKQAEPIWTNGERSVIAGAILGVILENMKGYGKPDRPELWNLTNVYHFIAEMCETKKDAKGKEQDPFVNKWLDRLPSGHQARSAFGAAKIAPGKTRGSFYTSALATLKLFSGANIYSMTSQSDYEPKSLGRDKTALFIILPDDKSTYYKLASVIVKQHYQKLVEDADARGGRLKRRVNFILDEFGNFAKIPDFLQYANGRRRPWAALQSFPAGFRAARLKA